MPATKALPQETSAEIIPFPRKRWEDIDWDYIVFCAIADKEMDEQKAAH